MHRYIYDNEEKNKNGQAVIHKGYVGTDKNEKQIIGVCNSDDDDDFDIIVKPSHNMHNTIDIVIASNNHSDDDENTFFVTAE